MNFNKVFLLLIFLLFCLNLTAQQVKPKFKSFKYVTYKMVLSGKNQKVIISDYIEINENGKLHFKTIYYNGIADTTYQLADSIIIKLNNIFNGKRKLTSYMVTDKVPADNHYAIPLSFISYTDSHNIIDNFIYFDPFMDRTFNNILNYLAILPAKAAYKGTAISYPLTQSQIIKYHNACKYLPKIEHPPTIMN